MINSKTVSNFGFSLSELSGSFADLGVMLPLTLALISLNGMNSTSVFVGVGVAYILTALVYRLPIPVQPLKSVSAVAISMGLAPVVIVTGAIWNALAFLGMGALGIDRWVKWAFPREVVRGIQLGLAFLLFKSAWKLVSAKPDWPRTLEVWKSTIDWNILLTTGALLILLVMLRFKKDWATLGVFAFGIGLASWQSGWPHLTLRFTLPTLFPLIPTWNQLLQGLVLLALPQIPLSLGNSIYATADIARQYFGERASAVTEKKLMLTMGVSDLVTAAIGGIPVCHGAGGLTAHYRLGARTGGAPLMIGTLFVFVGLLGGSSLTLITRLIPFAILGVLLAYVATQHALLARDLRGSREWITALLVLALTVWTGNLAIGFGSGSVFYHLWRFVERKAIPKIQLWRRTQQ